MVLQEASKLSTKEIILVLNGTSDRTGEIVKTYGCKIISHDETLENDVGRGICAKYATADCLLFFDADIKVQFMNHNLLSML